MIEPLGEGSYGSVWRARQIRLDREVAVKVLDPLVARDPNAARRFEREGRAAASLDHPSIVPVYEAGDDDDLYYLAMRLVDGETLAEVIDREAPIARGRLIELLAPIASALDTAHATGLIHRDVKPSNILLEDGRPYLADFGIAASARELGRYTTGSIGTAEYMSPEQARGEDVDHRSDLYALGCVAFHGLTGRSPFARDDIMATLLAHTTDDVPSTGDAGLDAFFARVLAKDPEDRYGSGAEFIEGLSGRRGAPPTVRTPVAPEVGSRSNRTWLLIGAAVAVVAALVAAALVIGGGSDDEPSANTPLAEPPGSEPPEVAATDVETSPDPTETADTTDISDTTVTGEVPASAPETAEAPVVALRDGGTVRVGTTLQLDDPNPHTNLDASKVLGEWVLPVMYRIDAQLAPVPSLATGAPEPAPGDPLLLSWTIRDDRTWNDGSPVTAADVVATHDYLTAPDTNALSTFLYDRVESVVAVSDTELSIRLSEPSGAAYLMYSSIHPIIQRSVWDEHLAGGGTAADFLVDGVDFSAGPYRVATGRQNPGEIELVPNAEWSGAERPALESIEVSTYGDSIALVEAKGRGEVDMVWVDDVARDELVDAQAIENTTTLVSSSSVGMQLTFNFGTDALNDVLVRRAIFHAIDREAITDTAVGRKVDSIVDPWNSLVFAPGQLDESQPFEDAYDPELAEQLLEQAGWSRPPGENVVRRNADGVDLEVQGVLLAENDGTNAAIEIANNLGDVGIQFRANPASSEITNDRINTGDFDLLLQFRIINNDPVATEFSFASDQCPATIAGCTGNGVNVGAFADPVTDELLAQTDVTTDPDERFGVYAALDEHLASELPAVPLYVEPAFVAYDDDIAGVEMAPNLGPFVSLAGWALLDE